MLPSADRQTQSLSATATALFRFSHHCPSLRGLLSLTHVLERIPQPKLDYPRLARTCNLAENAR